MTELNDVLSEIDALIILLDEARTILSKSILDAIDIEYTYDSNRIERNTLTLRETDIIINKGLTVGGKSMREHLEASNHYEAIVYIRELSGNRESITENTIRNIHGIILRGIDRDNAGRYRSLPVAISGSQYEPPQPWQVSKLMENLIFWVNEEASELHPVVYAAEIHERIATIYPFIDGNGRTARLVMNLILLQHGYTITDIKSDTESRLEYYDALEKCNIEGDKDDFILLIARYVCEGMKLLVGKLS